MDNTPASFTPQRPEGFEGLGTAGSVAFSSDERKWTEEFDLTDILHRLLSGLDLMVVRREDDWLHLPATDLYLRAEISGFQPRETQGVQTSGGVMAVHPRLFPQGLFEFQHATGEDIASSLESGLRGWCEIDLPVLLAAVSGDTGELTSLQMKFAGPPALTRRAVFGPVLRYAANPQEEACPAETEEGEAHSPFCPCCLLTHSLEAFHGHLEQDGLFALRLLVARSDSGEISADCRVNGVDFAAGQASLIEYGRTWPGSGFEMRKQYVVLQTSEAADAPVAD